jgi:hypothetical protein
LPSKEEGPGRKDPQKNRRKSLDVGLKSNTITVATVILLFAILLMRWGAAWQHERATVGLAPPVARTAADGAETATVYWSSTDQQAARDLRLRQIRAEVTDAAELYRHRHGEYPPDTKTLVESGLLESATHETVNRLGWTYTLLNNGNGYDLVL